MIGDSYVAGCSAVNISMIRPQPSAWPTGGLDIDISVAMAIVSDHGFYDFTTKTSLLPHNVHT